MSVVGSRDYNGIDYRAICTTSGVSSNKALHVFNRASKHIIVREDFVDFCFEFLSYKFGLVEGGNFTLLWSPDEWQQPSNKIYRPSLYQDFLFSWRVLGTFNKNFELSDATKINY